MTVESGEGASALAVTTDEQFLHTVSTANVIEADAALWSAFERFLGNDPPAAWALTEVTHKPAQVFDDEGNPTGAWELVSSGTWKRDPDVPTPNRQLVPIEVDDEVDAR